MAFTKPEFYIGVIVTVLIMIVGIITCGNALSNNPNINLNQESEDYIIMITGQESVSSLTSGYDVNISGLKSNDLIYESSEIGTPASSDQLASDAYFKDKADGTQNYFKLVYNIPSTIVVGLGLDLLAFTNYINIIVYALSVLVGITIWIRLIK